MQKQQIIENDQISQFIDVLVKELSEALQISKSDSTFILNQVGWDHIKIGDLFLKYNSIDQVLISLGLLHQTQILQTDEPIVCSICITNQINIQLSCNHQFCHSCLQMHIEEQLNNTSFPKCLYFGCNKIIPTVFYSHLEQFKNQVIQSVLRNKKKCGNKKCKYLIETSLQKWFARCQCGFLNCTLCQNGDHRPLTCAQTQQQLQLFQDLRGIEEQYPKNTFAQCPKCQIQIEKIFGCNRMLCKTSLGCGYQFCWICKESWTSVHYQCRKNLQINNVQKMSKLTRKIKNPNTILNLYKVQFQNEIQNKQDLDIIENCYDFLELADDLNRKEAIYISNNPGMSIQQFHQSFPYESFIHFKQKIKDIFEECYLKKQQLIDNIHLLSKYYKVANQFMDEYLDQFNQEQNQLK